MQKYGSFLKLPRILSVFRFQLSSLFLEPFRKLRLRHSDHPGRYLVARQLVGAERHHPFLEFRQLDVAVIQHLGHYHLARDGIADEVLSAATDASSYGAYCFLSELPDGTLFKTKITATEITVVTPIPKATLSCPNMAKRNDSTPNIATNVAPIVCPRPSSLAS